MHPNGIISEHNFFSRQVTDHAVISRSFQTHSQALFTLAFIGCCVESGGDENWGCECLQNRGYVYTVVCTILLMYPGCSNDSAASASCSPLSSTVSTPTVVVYAHSDTVFVYDISATCNDYIFESDLTLPTSPTCI